MKQLCLALLFALSIFLYSCKNSNSQGYDDNNVIIGNTYINNQVGWKMEIPIGWEVVSKEESYEKDLEGLKAIESTTKEKYDISQWNNTLAFKKNDQNSFSSTAEKYDPQVHGDWKKSNSALKKVIYETYLNLELKVDSSITKTENIDNIQFEHYSFTIYGPNNNIILNQLCYSQLINGFDFGVNINYNNEEDKNEMLSGWRNSKFSSD